MRYCPLAIYNSHFKVLAKLPRELILTAHKSQTHTLTCGACIYKHKERRSHLIIRSARHVIRSNLIHPHIFWTTKYHRQRNPVVRNFLYEVDIRLRFGVWMELFDLLKYFFFLHLNEIFVQKILHVFVIYFVKILLWRNIEFKLNPICFIGFTKIYLSNTKVRRPSFTNKSAGDSLTHTHTQFSRLQHIAHIRNKNREKSRHTHPLIHIHVY